MAVAATVAVLVAPTGAASAVTGDLRLPKTYDATFTGWERWSYGRPRLDLRVSASARFILSAQNAHLARYVTTDGSATWALTLEHSSGDHDGENGRIGDCSGTVTITRPIARGDGWLSLSLDEFHRAYEGVGAPRANPQPMVVPVSCVDTDTGATYSDTSSLQPQVWWQGVGTRTRYDRLEGKSRYGVPGVSEGEYQWLFKAVVNQTRIRVASLDFEPAIPVVRDGMSVGKAGGPIVQRIGEFDDGCGKGGIEWRDCRPSIPDGASERSWPFVVTAGAVLRISKATFRIEGPQRPSAATITGTAGIGGGRTLVFRSSQTARDGERLIVRNLKSTTPLPAGARYFSPLTIKWRVKTPEREYAAGASSHTIYVALREPLPARAESRLLTIMDLAARHANGARTENGVFAGIWKAFQSRAILRRHLDPATGTVTADPGGLLQYWSPWSLADQLTKSYSCPNSQTSSLIINSGIGACGGWANFLVDTLAAQGIESKKESLRLPPSVAGPPGAEWMLVKDWSFTTPSGSGDFPYVTDVYDCPSGVSYGRREVDDAAGIPGQGARAVANPPGWFKVHDHAYVVYRSRIYDPSYGSGPFTSLEKWAHASLDGFARASKIFPWLHNFELCTAWLVSAHRGF